MNRKLFTDNKALMGECIRLRNIVNRHENREGKNDQEGRTDLRLLESRIVEKNR